MTNEKNLIKQIIKQANPNAANELVTIYYKEIYSYVYKQTSDKELAMDLTQEIFINMLRSIRSYNSKKAGFRTWLYRIATNRITDYYRSKYYKYSKLNTTIDDQQIIDYEDIEEAIVNKEDLKKIHEIINQNNAINQQIFRLKLFGEYTFGEIAELMELSESTVKTKYYAIVKKIRKGFEND